MKKKTQHGKICRRISDNFPPPFFHSPPKNKNIPIPAKAGISLWLVQDGLCPPCTNSVRALPAPEIGRFPLSREWGVLLIFASVLSFSLRRPLFPPFPPFPPIPKKTNKQTSPSPIPHSPPKKIKTSPFPPFPHSRESGNLPISGAGRASPALHRFLGGWRMWIFSTLFT